jgi:SHS2 domain-containing protein
MRRRGLLAGKWCGRYLCSSFFQVRDVKAYEFIEHTADIVIKAYGDTVEKAFAEAASALFDVITDDAPVEPSQPYSISVDAVDRDGLLVNLLSKLILAYEIDSLVLTRFTVQFTGQWHLTATGYGEPFQAERHGRGIQVKGISYHMLEVFDGDSQNRAHVQVLFDI